MGKTIEKIKIQNAYDVYNASMGIIPKFKIGKIEIEALADTGSTYVCISKEDIKKLGLPFHKTVKVGTANGKVTRKIYEGAKIELKGRTFVTEVMENKKSTPALIGYLLLEALDLVVGSKVRKVIPNPAHGGKWVADAYTVVKNI
jgi:predicted aspartyl protease